MGKKERILKNDGPSVYRYDYMIYTHTLMQVEEYRYTLILNI